MSKAVLLLKGSFIFILISEFLVYEVMKGKYLSHQPHNKLITKITANNKL